MNRCYRLRRAIDIKRIRSEGKGYAHSLLILIVQANGESRVRIAVSANKSVGGAVERNRSKRQIREAFREILPDLKPGFDIICLARKGINAVEYLEIKTAVSELIERAQLFQNSDDQQDAA